MIPFKIFQEVGPMINALILDFRDLNLPSALTSGSSKISGSNKFLDNLLSPDDWKQKFKFLDNSLLPDV